MDSFFIVTASWKTTGGNIGHWSARWLGPDATTVRDAVADHLRADKRRRIAGNLIVTATLEH